jgi:Holliday junction resolvase
MSRGIARERYVKDWLEARGWWVARAAGSLGDADLVALRDGGIMLGDRIVGSKLLVEVKSTVTPYSHFGPNDRTELLRAGQVAAANVVLCWTPSARGRRIELNWLWPDQWPSRRVLPLGQSTEDGDA